MNGHSITRTARVLAATYLALVFVSGCLGSQGSSTPALGQPFVIKATETIAVDGGNLSVTFEKVAADSRCPVDVSCIWAGDATVALKVKKTNREAASLEIHTISKVEASYEDYRIQLQDLKPQPRSDTRIDPKAYAATLVITLARK